MALTSAEEAQTRELLAQQAAILSLADSEPAIISNLGATDVSLSDLTAATTIDDADLLLIRQGTTDKSIAGSIVKAAGSQPDASETVKGIVELATAAETVKGSDAVRAIHPSGLRAALKQIQPISASVSSNALTLTLSPTQLDFRSATLNSGAVNQRSIPSAISFVISSGSTLGTINAQAARIVVIAIDNAGTVELAAVNLAGGNNLDETTLITTVAEGGAGAADSKNVIYSTAARSNVPFRVVGFVDITEATAGTWGAAPSVVQGAGGQPLAAMSSLGFGQTWQDVKTTPGRAIATTYYNTTGKPITVTLICSAISNTSITVNGIVLGYITAINMINTFIVPHGNSYVVGGTTTLQAWLELR